jgi:hypothetical protein
MIYMCNNCKAEAHPGACSPIAFLCTVCKQDQHAYGCSESKKGTDLLNVFLADSRKAIADLDGALGRFKATLN